jgi:hypothetical protein
LYSSNIAEIVPSDALLVVESDDIIAKRYHDQGIQMATSGDYQNGVSLFRAACRLKPSDPWFWNDLGVTELRMGDYKRAQKRFIKAIELEPNYDIAKNNLREVKQAMSQEDFDYYYKKFPQKHHLKDLKELDPNHPSLALNATKISMSHYEILNEPWIIKKALQNWGWNISKLTTNYFIEKYGPVRVDFYPQNMLIEPVYPFFTTLQEAVSRLTNPPNFYNSVDASEPGTYIQWNMPPGTVDEILADINGKLPSIFDLKFWTDKCFDHQDYADSFHFKTHIKMILIAEKGAGMFNHQDSLHGASFQIQIEGRKKWHLCPDSESPYLYNPGQVDAFNPDYEKYPKYLNASCFQFILEPGDVLYYPKRHWHQTINLDTPSISYSHTMVTPQNYENVTAFLQRSCLGLERMFSPEPEFCRQLGNCYKFWEDTFKLSRIPSDGLLSIDTSTIDKSEL